MFTASFYPASCPLYVSISLKGEVFLIKRRIILIISAVLAFVLLTGFVDVSTDLSVNSTFAGTREMTLSFNTQKLESLLAGGPQDLERLIKSGIPSGMEYTSLGYSEDRSTVDYQFTVKFASLAEYTSKVSKIVGHDVNVEFEYNNNKFTRNTKLVESFDTTSLFGWLQNAFNELVGIGENGQYVNPSLPDTTWTERDARVSINNTVYDLNGGNISVQDSSGRMVQSVAIETVIGEDMSFNRRVVMQFDPTIGSTSFASVCDTVKSFMPEGSQFSFVDSSSERSCTIEFTASGTAQLSKFTSQLFGNTFASATMAPFEERSINMPLSSMMAFEDSCSLAVISDNEEIPFTYTIESYAGLPYKLYDINTGAELAAAQDGAGNVITYSGTGKDFSFRLLLESMSTAQGIDYNLKVNSPNSFSREIKIYLAQDTEMSVLQQMAGYYGAKADSRSKVKIVAEEGKMPYISIVINGNAAQLCSAESALFGLSDGRTLSYERQGGLFRMHPSSTLIDSYDISSLLSLTNISTYSYALVSNDTIVSYTVNSNGTDEVTTEELASVSDENAGITYTLDEETTTIWQPTLLDGSMSFTFTGRYTNLVAILFICLLGLLLILLLILAYSIFFADDDEDEDEEIPAQLAAPEETVRSLPEPRNLPEVFEEPVEELEALPIRIVDEEPDDMLGIFTGIDVQQKEPEPMVVPAPQPAPEPIPEPAPEPVPEPIPEPEPAPAPIPEPVPAPDPYADYVERFPMEDLPPITPSPCNTVDEYSSRGFIEDLRYLGLLEEYKKHTSRVKVKVRRRQADSTQPKGSDGE